MKRRPALFLLALAALIFFSWIGWLAYLAIKTHNTGVLSQPQLLVSDLVVSAQIDVLDRAVTIEEVIYPLQEAARWNGNTIQVVNLKECQGWGRPGRYFLLLNRNFDGQGFRVAPIPPSPGYAGDAPRIYPHTPSTEVQLKEMLAQIK
jgi:hypothetical protein